MTKKISNWDELVELSKEAKLEETEEDRERALGEVNKVIEEYNKPSQHVYPAPVIQPKGVNVIRVKDTTTGETEVWDGEKWVPEK